MLCLVGRLWGPALGALLLAVAWHEACCVEPKKPRERKARRVAEQREPLVLTDRALDRSLGFGSAHLEDSIKEPEAPVNAPGARGHTWTAWPKSTPPTFRWT